MANVQRSGWIRGHELDVDGALLAGVGATVLVAGRDYRTESLGEHVRDNTEVDEPRARDVGRADSGAREVDALDDGRREIARLLAERLREHHREIRRPIAERRIARTLDDRLDGVRRAE